MSRGPSGPGRSPGSTQPGTHAAAPDTPCPVHGASRLLSQSCLASVWVFDRELIYLCKSHSNPAPCKEAKGGETRLLTLDLDGAQFPVLHGEVLEGAI